MSLYLVGHNIDRHTAHSRFQSGVLERVAQGVYVDAGPQASRIVMEHAVRIAAFLYPQSYLAGISAQTRMPTDDGRLFISGRRNLRTRIRELEIVQNRAPDAPSTVSVTVADSLGEMTLTAASPRQRFLEAFRRRSEIAAAMDPAIRRRIAERLIEEYATVDNAADELWRLARPNGWTSEAEAAEQYLRVPAQGGWNLINPAEFSLTVAWHGVIVGHLSHDGAEWRWSGADARIPPVVRASRPGSLPPFIESLLPEGWLAEILDGRDERDLLKSGKRYMSNISIVRDDAELAMVPADVLQGRLAHFNRDGNFSGKYHGPARDKFDRSFQENLARLFAAASTPRLSGVQIKAPMFLSAEGNLFAAADRPFTHILKPAGTNGFEALPIVEWIGMTLARAAGFEVPEVALVLMPDGLAPSLLVERFDIRRSDNDHRMLAMEDFCSILELPPERKYEGTIERMAKGIRSLSTQPEEDLKTLFMRSLYAWFIADGDMHLKNLALLKTAELGSENFEAVRFAPVYDAVTTRVFPGLAHDRMALKLNGKDDRLRPDDFLALAKIMELPAQWAATVMSQLARCVADAAGNLALPEPFAVKWDAELDRVRNIVGQRTDPFV